MELNLIKEKFKALYGTEGTLYTSPGRINLIGEHTDYNGGFVLPGAIDKGMYCEIKPNGTDKVRAFALDLEESAEFGLGENDLPSKQWAKYIYGVCREMIKKGKTVPGFDTVFSGDVPLGAGMSSSAALESCFGFAINDQFNLGFDRFELALIGQATEHNYVGVMCGIMDQFASCFGKEGSLIRLDCRSLEYEYIPFHPAGYRLVLVNTCVSHNLAEGAYNKRRQSCERVAATIKKYHPEVELLRDANLAMLREVANEVSAEDYIRAEFVIEEIKRMDEACDALKADDYETVGKKMYETHIGLSRKYEVSCEELDFLNDIARECGVAGSRVMGGGFGGCTINLVKNELYDGFIKRATESYEQKFKIKPKVYDVVIKDGARKL
ncbi:galactokinase [Dysgonomonas sp. PFB1-18]|uniref:galactokinase n=1 Tax=unclassified Dysgonomonas TaxID=2630389 RepID=UPI0024735102|nr:MULTISPECIES: galactokinase [unclassified Dysgonomonas]MDH6309168.1 galactokinase [Dysgonomonas sp. PF1-14]MDH6338952.1 galactokinase [Dysgonomonas sp. PF1-16]MDH6380417.1 galactokinase [Dysgonomonas sp. PFB1-18]MDH6397780.1 galactokinase [Dysgonomonas sp. PF1-23]